MSKANDKFDFFPGTTAQPMEKYKQPRVYTDTMGSGTGYPNKTANTQTLTMRGAGAARRGNKTSTKMG